MARTSKIGVALAEATIAGAKAERTACAALADAWSARFDALLSAGGNDVIDERAARQLRRYFAAFATEIRAEMHLSDGAVLPCAPAEVVADA